MGYSALLDFVLNFRRENPDASKQDVAAAAADSLRLTKHRSIYACDDYAVRFSAARGASFSNVVLSLSALQAFDRKPVVVVVLRPDSTEFLLANTTFLKKISHSSHQLRIDHIRGSFLGHDIMREYGGIANTPGNFDTLFSIHEEFRWQENVARLVEATNAISGRGTRFPLTDAGRAAILDSPELAVHTIADPAYQQVRRELATIIQERSARILQAAQIDNVNLRGNEIERLITGGINEHNLADMVRHVGDVELQLEIKTRLMDRTSSPKAYNVDKALAALSTGRTCIAFCFVGINVAAEQVANSMASIFDRTVLNATRIQFHWAGRNSRGVTQLTGDLTPLFRLGFQEQIDVAQARRFVQELMSL